MPRFAASDLGLHCLLMSNKKDDMLSRLFIAALWSLAGKELTSWLSFVMLIVFCHFPFWYPGSGVALDCIDS